MGLLLRAATLAGGSTCAGVRLSAPVTADVRVDGDHVAWIDPPGTLAPAPGDAEHDLTGYLLLPAPAEPHAHLDLALLSDRVPNPAGDLAGALKAVENAAPGITRTDLLARARQAARLYLAHGATAVRTHVQVGGAAGLAHLEAVREVRRDLQEAMALQIVALPVPPVTGATGAGSLAALRDALAAGADLVGGAPHLDPDPGAATACLLQAAADAGTGADLHVPGVDGLCDLARAVRTTGFGGAVTAGLGTALGVHPPEEVAAHVAAAGIGVVALPQGVLPWAPGRGPAATGGSAAVRALLAAGVTLGAGGGDLRGPIDPMGRGDPLEAASLLVTAARLTPAEAYTAVSAGARAVMGLPPVPADGVLTNGVPAELLAVRATGLADAIASADPDRTVIGRGQVTVRTRLTRTYRVRLARS